jgi:hypothetical protein
MPLRMSLPKDFNFRQRPSVSTSPALSPVHRDVPNSIDHNLPVYEKEKERDSVQEITTVMDPELNPGELTFEEGTLLLFHSLVLL